MEPQSSLIYASIDVALVKFNTVEHNFYFYFYIHFSKWGQSADEDVDVDVAVRAFVSCSFIFSFLITFALFLSCLRTGNIRNQVPSNDRAGTKWQGNQSSVLMPQSPISQSTQSTASLLGVNLFLIFIIYQRYAIAVAAVSIKEHHTKCSDVSGSLWRFWAQSWIYFHVPSANCITGKKKRYEVKEYVCFA